MLDISILVFMQHTPTAVVLVNVGQLKSSVKVTMASLSRFREGPLSDDGSLNARAHRMTYP